MRCLHCRLRPGMRRGLCWTCYYHALRWGWRHVYPLAQREQCRYAASEIRDYYGNSELPQTPTRAQPGSEEKIAVLAARALRGERLWHALDAPGD